MAGKLKLVETTPGGPPRPLGKHGMALWRSIVTEYDVTDAAGIELLCSVIRLAPTTRSSHRTGGGGVPLPASGGSAALAK